MGDGHDRAAIVRRGHDSRQNVRRCSARRPPYPGRGSHRQRELESSSCATCLLHLPRHSRVAAYHLGCGAHTGLPGASAHRRFGVPPSSLRLACGGGLGAPMYHVARGKCLATQRSPSIWEGVSVIASGLRLEAEHALTFATSHVGV
jgi:hypothetical protein